MLAVRSFGVTHSKPNCEPGHGAQTAIAVGVVSIAKEHLIRAPESLLSIAAKQSPDSEVIPLSSWPEPSVTTLKAVAECFARSGEACELVSPSEMLKALEYFIVPRSMWPVGLRYAATMRDQLDSMADRIMSHVKADFEAPPCKLAEADAYVKQYQIPKSLEFSGQGAPCVLLEATLTVTYGRHASCSCRQGGEAHCHYMFSLPAPLRQKLVERAKGCFLELKFNPTVKQPHTHPWAFEVRAPSV